MGRHFTPDVASPYYPPRARWYAFLFKLATRARRQTGLDRIHLPGGVTLLGLAVGTLVPGAAVYLRGFRMWGLAVMAACAGLLGGYVFFLGQTADNVFLGLLISIHASGFVLYCRPLLSDESFGARIRFTLLVLLALLLLYYLPARNYVQRHWLTPMQMNGQSLLVRRTPPTHAVSGGEIIAYSYADVSAGNYHGGVVVAAGGINLGPVLAVGGDRVVFSPAGYSVNGVLHPSQSHMPESGEWVVPEKHWFIWPNLAISGHGQVNPALLSSTLLQLADVRPEQYLGQPFEHWFGRKQVVP